MKVLVGYRRDRQAPTMLEVVADGTATANDVAVALASAGNDQPVEGAEALTLSVTSQYGDTRTLSPDVLLAESGLQSGTDISLVDGGPHDEAPVGAVVTVVDGPNHGIEVPVRFGTSYIGRSPMCHVRLSDGRVSKRHAKLLIGRTIEVIDDNSANGVSLGGQRIERATLNPGDVITLGETQLRVTPVAATARIDNSTDVRYLRPPVVQSRPQASEIELPEVPGHQARPAFPWLALIAPLVMGAVMYLFTRSTMSLIFVAISPLLMVSTYIGNVVDNRRKTKAERENFDSGMQQVTEEITASRAAEGDRLRLLYPSVSECVAAAMNRDTHLWSRRPEHPEFLQVRLGQGSLPALAAIKEPRPSGISELVAQQRQLCDDHHLVHGVPIVADLRSVGGVGLCGDARHLAGVARGLVSQVAILHSPAEVVIACLTSNEWKEQWAWLDWLPHCSSPHSPLGSQLLASDSPRGRAVLDRLEELIDARAADAAPTPRGPLDGNERVDQPVTPSVLVVVHSAAVATERIAAIAERGPDVGVHVLWVGDSRQDLPAACRTFLEITPDGSATVGMVRSERLLRQVSTEAMDLATAGHIARGLAPVVDASAPVDDQTDLPRAVSLVGLLGKEEATVSAQVLARWQENRSLVERFAGAPRRERAADLRALVGHGGQAPFTLDLRTQGPHALVGGTTGSGKSEFLQAWVLGLAHAYSPDHVTFLFVDYKGGAAFAKCDELPHCVGTVTDLSPYLVRRALRSLRAEIHRRERLFNEKGVKDLVAFEKTGDPDCPPSLIIVVDEFAALVGEVPEFIDGVIDVAQRGRSLGLHLILATQRPAGVIKDSLRANTNLRIALRVNDAHDSTDVLGSAAAADIDPSTPGRGVARVGPGRLIPFQSAFPGALTPDEPPAPPIDVEEIDFGSHQAWKIPRPSARGPVVDKDISRVVDTIVAAAAEGKLPEPRRPWLGPLDSVYDLSTLRQRSDAEIVLGMVDYPDFQEQRPDHFRPDESGNIVYYGAGGSGKTSALRSLAIAASITPRSGPVHTYGLDFGGGGLAMLEALPNVGAIVSGDDEERIARLMAMLSGLLDERAAQFSAVRADSLRAYRERPGQADTPRLLVLLDGFGAFREAYDSGLSRQVVYAQFQRLVNEGRSVGIHFAVTADRPSTVPSSMQGSFQHRVVLRMADQDSYLSLGVPKDVLGPASPPGRAMNATDPNELQLAILGTDPSPIGQTREIERLARNITLAKRPAPVLRLPEQVPASQVPATVGGLPTLGMEDTTLDYVGFEPQGAYVVAGPPRSGLSSAVRWLAESLRRTHPSVPLVLLTPRESELASLNLWTAQLTGTAQVKDYLQTNLAPYYNSAAQGTTPSVAIFVDRFGELIGSEADAALTEALKQVRRNGHLLIASGETSTFSGGFSNLLTELKNARAGLLLQPQQNDGDLVKTQLPRLRTADFPRGRGYWVANNEVLKVQLPEVD